MSEATFYFHAQLTYFLARHRPATGFTHQFEDHPSIKDMIESLGIPHTEVKRIVVNGATVDFNYHVQHGDHINVYPDVSTTHIATSNTKSEDNRFILDVHLGRLAAYLRMMGFDTLYRNDYDDPELAQISSDEDRILLTRDLGLLKRSLVRYGYYVRNTDPNRQLAEVLRQYNLLGVDRPFHRCLNCNGLLEVVTKESIDDRLTARTKQYYDDFRICRSCDKVYWQGSHYQKMRQLIDRVLSGDVIP